jgi:hypothetical protein
MGHLYGKTLFVLETTIISVSYLVLWKGTVMLNTKTQYFMLLIFSKYFVPLLAALKQKVREGY